MKEAIDTGKKKWYLSIYKAMMILDHYVRRMKTELD